MAQSTEKTDIPMPLIDIETATDVLAQGAAMLLWQRQEIQRQKRQLAGLEEELAGKDETIARFRHQLAILREPA